MNTNEQFLGRDAWCLLGLPIDATTESGTLDELRDCMAEKRKCFFTTPNLNFLIASLADEPFRRSVLDSDWVVADGMPLVWIARLLDIPIPERVPGSGVFERLRREAKSDEAIRVFFFGGPEGVAQTACDVLNADDTPMLGVGCHYPGFGTVEDMSSDEVIAQINATNPDFVLVALGARKGQAWIERNRDRLDAPVISHLGAVVNFVAGTVERAPRWVQQTGLEWVWRIYQEPSLFKRYWADGVAMLKLLTGNVLPLWRYRRRTRRTLPDAPMPRCSAQLGDRFELTLTGSFHHATLNYLRAALVNGCDSGLDLELDLSGVEAVDCAFVGLLQLAESLQRRQGRALILRNVPLVIRDVLGWCRADYLLKSAA